MLLELAIALIVSTTSIIVFARFATYTPTTQKIAKWSVYFASVILVTLIFGRPWSLIWSAGSLGLLLVLHFVGCWRQGIHPITTEPREKYLAMRGWTALEAKKTTLSA
jgi:hypothetical protein